jgi:DNA-binding NarL/FixJ family response regulator
LLSSRKKKTREEQMRVVIVEDHHLFRKALKLILKSNNVDVEDEFASGKDFLERLPGLHPDVVIMDIAMPEMDGVETSRQALMMRPDLKILVLSMFGDEDYYYKMISTGVRGFVLKESHPDELMKGIITIAIDENYFSQELLRKIIFKYGSINSFMGKEDVKTFSERELEVLNLLCQGMTNAEIAEALHISQRTAEGHRASMLRKTDTKNTVALIMYALKAGIVKI